MGDMMAIKAFLAELRQIKGDAGRVSLEAHHWHRQTPHTRDLIVTGNINRPSMPMGGLQPTAGPTSRLVDGILQLGELVEFQGVAPNAGYVHLFNLGTSGTVYKLGPSRQYPHNRVERGERFILPSARLFQSQTGGPWIMQPPTTQKCGEPERILTILTTDDTDLQITDLHPKLVGRDVYTPCPSRGPSFAAAARVDVAKLFSIPTERWEYGLLELGVTE